MDHDESSIDPQTQAVYIGMPRFGRMSKHALTDLAWTRQRKIPSSGKSQLCIPAINGIILLTMMQQRQNLKAKYDRSAAITPEASPDPEIIEKIPKKRSSSTLKTILFALAMALSLSMVVTDSLTFGYKIQFGKIRNYIIPRKKREQKEYTPAQLAEFTGENGSPIYLGIK